MNANNLLHFTITKSIKIKSLESDVLFILRLTVVPPSGQVRVLKGLPVQSPHTLWYEITREAHIEYGHIVRGDI